jgi:hypothetical protein
MIQESRYWKAPLLRAANWLERLRMEELSYERSIVRIERELFIGFYSIRKLLETYKISPSTRTMKLSITWSPCIKAKAVDYLNTNRISELFDLAVTQREERDIAFICNQFVHSYIFAPVQAEDNSLAGVYVSSDRERSTKVFFVEITQILHSFRTVGTDYPNKQRLERDEKTLEWKEITQKDNPLTASP